MRSDTAGQVAMAGREAAVEEDADALEAHHLLLAQLRDALVDEGRIGAGRREAVAGAARDLLHVARDAR